MRFVRSLALLEMRLWKLLLAAVVVAIGVASLPAQDKLGAGNLQGHLHRRRRQRRFPPDAEGGRQRRVHWRGRVHRSWARKCRVSSRR